MTTIPEATIPDWRGVHDFWFPPRLDEAAADSHLRLITWWMGGGANAEIGRFAPLVQAALAGRLDAWAEVPRGRLSLVLLLDQFTRGLGAGTPAAYAGDARALALAEAALAKGHAKALAWPWERMFLLMPLVHAEGPRHLARAERAVVLAHDMAEDAPEHLRAVYRASAGKAAESCEVIRRFGRFPHRNPILGRASTPEELDYLAAGDFPHARPLLVEA
jgi:uncharacterized protein (DUF924 family)